MSAIMRMAYVCKSDPSIRFYDEVGLKTFVEANATDRRYTFWDTIYECFDETAGSEIHTSLNLAFSPKDTINERVTTDVINTASSVTRTTASYIRFTGSAPGTTTVPPATGSGRRITFKNQSEFTWTLDTTASNLIDGSSTFIVPRKCSITLVDATTNAWDII